MQSEDTKIENTIIAHALTIIESRLRKPGIKLSSPDAVKSFLRLHLAQSEHEIFAILFLDVKNRLTAYDPMFRGTLIHASVYPREIVKAALTHNAASVILAHSHPSGTPEPSESDLLLTRTLIQALALVDTKVLDHIIVGGNETYSFAEHGKI
jgi:DNA repair protein RadC